MDIMLRRIGEHRGAPRLYLDCAALQRAGFAPGQSLDVSIDAAALRVSLRVCSEPGSRRVSRKRRGGCAVPVIDINCASTLAPFVAAGVVRIVLSAGALHILLPASMHRAIERAGRLATRISLGLPLRTGGIAFGAGIASAALHDGLAAGGVAAVQALANEICEDYLQLAAERSPVVGAQTALAAVPMQELAADDWLLGRIGPLEVLEAGIPCSGASRAGAAKRHLTRMEDHPMVGHLVGSLLELIRAMQPCIVVVENVVSYRDCASATILRAWLRDAGYAVHEVEVNARDLGSLEARVRWFLVACPTGMPLDLGALERLGPVHDRLLDVLENVPDTDPRWREVKYLKSKQARDRSKGSNFKMQWLDADARQVPTLRKGYHKGGSTDPRLVHPNDPRLSRLLTGREHARIKGVPQAIVEGLPETLAHQVCGQAVDMRPVNAIGRRLGEAMLAWARRGDSGRLWGQAEAPAALLATGVPATG